MARKKKSAESTPAHENGVATAIEADVTTGETIVKKTRGRGRKENGNSIQGYFRELLAKHPEWVVMRSNDPIFDQWLADNPGQTEVPQSAKNGLSNVKSALRNKVRVAKKGRGRPRKVVAAGAAAPTITKTKPAPISAAAKVTKTMEALELLEEQIDECLNVAKKLGKDEFHQVIVYLRRARNTVVMKMGE